MWTMYVQVPKEGQGCYTPGTGITSHVGGGGASPAPLQEQYAYLISPVLYNVEFSHLLKWLLQSQGTELVSFSINH